jgi:SAM-dependent methyltransferase
VGLLEREPLEDLVALDVGTGTGRLALRLATRCRRVIGIDRDAAAVAEARRRARRAGLSQAEFVVADAEAGDYASYSPDLVAAHLCMSDAIIDRAGRALAPGRVLGFVAFHADQWRETGRRSRFAYDPEQVERVLTAAGFVLEYCQVNTAVEEFASLQEALAAVAPLEPRWRGDGRWDRYRQFLDRGGRTLTRSHLVCCARRR